MIDSQEKVTALYCRYSHEDDRSGNGSSSVKNQIDILSKYAAEHNFRPFKVYADDGFTGTTFDRPQFIQMIKDIESGTVGTVICKDSSRLGRNHVMVGYYTEIFFLEHDVRFIAVCDNVDSEVSPDEMGPFRNIMNEMYAKDISTKTRASLYNRGKNGKKMTNHPIYGYKLDENGEWIIDEYAAGVVKRIFSMFLAGNGRKTIAATLTNEGILNPTAYRNGGFKPNKHVKTPYWSESTIKEMLHRQEYCGDTVNFKTKKLSYKSKKKVKRPPEERMIFSDTHPAIISREIFADTQKMLEKKMRQYSGKRIAKETMFHGILICKDCKNKLSASGYTLKNGILVRYVCNSYRKHSTLRTCTSHAITEKVLIGQLTDSFKTLFKNYRDGSLSTSLKEMIGNDTKQRREQLNKELAEIKKRMDEIDGTIKCLYTDKAMGVISIEAFMDVYNQFKVEKGKLEVQYYELLNGLNNSDDPNLSAIRFLKVVESYAQKRGRFKITREMVLDLVDHIEIGEKDKNGAETRHIDIYFKYVGMLQKNNP